MISLLTIFLASCASGAITAVPIKTSTSLPLVLTTGSPRPTEISVISPGPTQLSLWTKYQEALGKVFIPIQPAGEVVLCEWELLGQVKSEVYVWAFCQLSGPIPTATSAPAVIYLATDGTVQSIVIPGDGSNYAPDVRSLFPKDVQAKIFCSLHRCSKNARPYLCTTTKFRTTYDCSFGYCCTMNCMKVIHKMLNRLTQRAATVLFVKAVVVY
jgi:hypothetical protein